MVGAEEGLIEGVPGDGQYGTDLRRWGACEITSASIEIAGRRVRFVEAGAGGLCFVLVHGMGGRWQHWLPTISFLSERGRVLAVDLPGFGESDPLEGPPSPGRFADVTAELCRRSGAADVVLIGHSMAGPIAMQFASRHSDLARAIVLVGGTVLTFSALLGFRDVRRLVRQRPRETAATYSEVATAALPAPRPIRRLIARSRAIRRAILWPYLWRPGLVSPELAALLVDGAGAPGVLPTARGVGRSDPRAGMPDVRCPVLSVGARHDLITPVADLEQFAREFPQAESVLLEGCGHMLMLERPDAFHACLARFIDRIGLQAHKTATEPS